MQLELYHGTRLALDGAINPERGDSRTSLGIGFYCSDRLDIARDYWRDGGYIYQVSIAGPTDGHLNLEAPLSAQSQRVGWALGSLAVALGVVYRGDCARSLLQALEERSRDCGVAFIRNQEARFRARGSRYPEAHAVRTWLTGQGVWLTTGMLEGDEISGRGDRGIQYLVLDAAGVCAVQPLISTDANQGPSCHGRVP